MTKVVVNPGICGFLTSIEVEKTAGRKVRVRILSDCETVTKLGESLTEVDQRDVIKQHANINRTAWKFPLHPSCPVPVAIIKAVEVEGGLALPRDVVIHFEKPD
ncbi:MAG: hypothetical protein PHV74_03035 [Dehalococcoidia bacterium]|nr:hypothetical protein [Dehalococcoidia bacterium]